MKRLTIAFLLICSTCFSQTLPSWNQLRSTFKDTITQAKINDATAKITKLAILENFTITENLTFPASATVTFLPGGKLTIASGVVVTFNGPLEADRVQIFDGLGKTAVVFADNVVPFAWCEWWGGGVGVSGTINQPAMQAAINIAKHLRLGRGFYFVTTGIILPSGASITGEGQALTTIITGTPGAKMITSTNFTSGGGYVLDQFLKDFTLNGAGIASLGIGLGDSTITSQVVSSANSSVENVAVAQCLTGVQWYGSVYNSLIRCKIQTTGSVKAPGTVGLWVDYSQYLDVDQVTIEGFETNVFIKDSNQITFTGGNVYNDDYSLGHHVTTSLLTLQDSTRCGFTGTIFEWNIASESYPLIRLLDTGAGSYYTTDNYLDRCYLISLDNPPTSGKAMIQVGNSTGKVQRTLIRDCYMYPAAATKEHIRIASASLTLVENTKLGTGYSSYDTLTPTIVGDLDGASPRAISQVVPQLLTTGQTTFGVSFKDLATASVVLVSTDPINNALEFKAYVDTPGANGIVGVRVLNSSTGTVATATYAVKVWVKPL